ncbi:MAG: 4-hydroxy-3-methylbut-2-enyl diphosphate reductase [Deltaproteobacteria bacterium]|nr:4-hydroxy-3-methylbut-2-enyl diphosphate reductase [Deltaproteobacteria bacterium]
MEIILAQNAGFCFGVKRATQMAFEAAAEHEQICSLGPLIHSPQVVKELTEQGIKVVNNVEDIPSGSVIIRSHGVTAEEMDRVQESNLTVVDATCPFVKKTQEYAVRLSKEGYTVVIVGEVEHPEVQGIVSYSGEAVVHVVANAEQAAALKRVGLVAQTTQLYENLRAIMDVCLSKSQEIRVFNTICDATSVRQNEAREIAQSVDLMFVIGGHASANTTRLASICREIQPKSWHIETAEEIHSDWFSGVNKVGVTAGASTPRWLIDEVVARIAELGK